MINPNGVLVGPSGDDRRGAAPLTLSTLDALGQRFAQWRFRLGTAEPVVLGSSTTVLFQRADVTILGNFYQQPGIYRRGSLGGARGRWRTSSSTRPADGATISVRGGAPRRGNRNRKTPARSKVEMCRWRPTANSYAMAINNSGTVRAKGYNFRGGAPHSQRGAQRRNYQHG